jgi:hypothetical protein
MGERVRSQLVHVGIAVNTQVALGQVFLRVLRLSPSVSFHHLSILKFHRSPRRYLIEVTDNAVVQNICLTSPASHVHVKNSHSLHIYYSLCRTERCKILIKQPAVTLTKSQVNPLLHNGPADILGHPILQRQELTEVTSAQVTFHHHHLAAAVVVVEYKFLLNKQCETSVYARNSTDCYGRDRPVTTVTKLQPKRSDNPGSNSGRARHFSPLHSPHILLPKGCRSSIQCRS